MLQSTLNRSLALTVCVCVVAAGITAPRARAAEPSPRLLRDAIPAASFVAAPPDTGADDFFLPEETDNKKLIQDIAVFVIVAAFVAVFIIEIFFDKDTDEPPPVDPGKPIPHSEQVTFRPR